MRTRTLWWESRWILVAVFLAAAILIGAAPPAVARIGDGRLVLHWRGPTPEGSAFLLSPPGDKPMVVRLQDRPDSTASFDDIASGRALLDLAGPDGRPLLRWNLLVVSELTTTAVVQLDTGVLEVSAIHPDPFGNTEEWGPADLAALPGLGIDGARLASIPSSAIAAPEIRGAMTGLTTRFGSPVYGLDRDAIGYQQPLGNAAAWLATPTPWILTDRSAAAGFSLLAGGASGAGRWGRVRARAERQLGPFGHTEAEAVIGGAAIGDAGPLGIGNDKLPNNDLQDMEVLGRVFAQPAGGLLRLHLHALGISRNHFLQEFARDTEHNPRQDRSALTASAAWDRRVGRHALWLEAGYSRSLNKTGDGQAFDALREYRIGTNGYNDRVSDDGLYWWGGGKTDPSVPPHLYNYYTQELATTWTLRGESRLRSSPRTPLRLGAEGSFTTWRWYEHLDPIIDAKNTAADGGFQYASYLGYTRDASAHMDDDLHAAPKPRTLALFASQQVPMGPATLEAGARWSSFSPGQGALRDLANPFSGDSIPDAADFLAVKSLDGVDPRVGLFLPLGERAAAWIDMGRTRETPPLEALYVSPERLLRQAGWARDGQLHSRSESDQVFGNPALKAMLHNRLTVGLHRDLLPGLALRLTGRMEQVLDSWVARRVDAGKDSLTYYDNRGKQRERGLRVAVDAVTTKRSRLRLAWDVSRRETNVIEPAPLYRGLLLPGLPTEGTGVRETGKLPDLWLDDPSVQGWFPSIFDRTHQVSLAWLARLDRNAIGSVAGSLLDRGDVAVMIRAASGRPYTPTYVAADGLMGGNEASAFIPGDPIDRNGNDKLDASEVNAGRMPWTWQIDLGLQRRFRLVQCNWTLFLEARNLLGQKNPRAVYGATGEVDNDGWLDSGKGRTYLADLVSRGKDAEKFRQDYLDRLDDPNRYEEGRTLRVALGLDL
jgi:hypothetical protein